MLQWRRIQTALSEWDRLLESFEDRTLFQSAAWLRFLQQCVHGELVFAALEDGKQACGYFAGIIVTKLGLRILGSPLPGWTTSYMGMALQPGVSRMQAFEALIEFAFRELRCVHLEFMDRHLLSIGTSQNSK